MQFESPSKTKLEQRTIPDHLRKYASRLAPAWQLRKTKTRDRRRKALMGGVAISWG
jgi:hypothetical protein